MGICAVSRRSVIGRNERPYPERRRVPLGPNVPNATLRQLDAGPGIPSAWLALTRSRSAASASVSCDRFSMSPA